MLLCYNKSIEAEKRILMDKYSLSQKIFAAVLILCAFASCFCVSAFAIPASGEPAIYADNVILDKDDKAAAVKFTLQNNPGFTGLRIWVSYDASALELQKSNISDVDGNVLKMQKGGISSLNIQTDADDCIIPKNPFLLSWVDDLAKKNCTNNGVIATLYFNILPGAEEGRAYPITLKCEKEKYDIISCEGKAVTSINVYDGSVSIGCPHLKKRIVAVSSTCITKGYEQMICADCNKVLSTNEMNYTEHSWVAGDVTPPTETEMGYTTYICGVCNAHKKDDFTSFMPKDGDVPVITPDSSPYYVDDNGNPTSTAVIPDPTPIPTDENGYIKEETPTKPLAADEAFLNCQYVKSAIMQALGHEYTEHVNTVESVNGERGYDVYKCAHCDSTIKRNFTEIG